MSYSLPYMESKSLANSKHTGFAACLAKEQFSHLIDTQMPGIGFADFSLAKFMMVVTNFG